MSRRQVAITVAVQSAGRGPLRFDAEEQDAWPIVCEQVYRRGLRIVPPSEGGVLPAWTHNGHKWSTVLIVEPVESRPRTWTRDEPWIELVRRMHARGMTDVDAIADRIVEATSMANRSYVLSVVRRELGQQQ